MIGLVNRFGSIIVKCDESVSTGFRPLSTRALCALELRDLNPVDTSWSAFNYYMSPRSQTGACAPLWYQYVAMSIYDIRRYDPGCHMQCVKSCRHAISQLLPLSHFQLCPTHIHICHCCHVADRSHTRVMVLV